MKKTISLFLAIVLAVSLAACAGKESGNGDTTTTVKQTDDTQFNTSAAAYKSTGESSGKSFETILDSNEYTMYYNIFYNDMGADFADKPVFKKGIFTTLYDGYSKRNRYYVWGYNDQTKCCDWQWEILIDDEDNLPSNGSTVEVTGTLTASEEALDGYWITSPKITVKTAYKAPDAEVDMSTMGGTLLRVQSFYLMNKDEALEGKSVLMYGRVKSPTSIEHPYYNIEDFEITVDAKEALPAIGTMVLVEGTIKDGAIVNATATVTTDY